MSSIVAQRLLLLQAVFGAALFGFMAFSSLAYAEDGATATDSDSAKPTISVTSEPVEILVDPKTGKIIGNREAPPPGTPKPIKEIKENAADLKGKVMENRMEAQNKMMEAKGAMKDFRASTTDAIKDFRASTTNAIKNIRGDIKEKLASTTEAMKERLQAKKKELTEKAKERAKAFLERAIKHLNTAHERLTKFVTRIEERMAKLKEAGATVTGAETALGLAKTELAEADVAIGELEEALATPITDTTEEGIRAHLASIKEMGDAAKTAIREAHEAIRALLEAVKSAADTLPDTAADALES